jgi:outer membrane murein-binding lipoprotein Lpp
MFQERRTRGWWQQIARGEHLDHPLLANAAIAASRPQQPDFSSSAQNGLWQSVVGLRNAIMEAGMTDQYLPINWNNLPDSSKITMLRDRTDQLTTQLHQLTTQVRQLTGQVQQLASVFATMQAGLNEMQARLDDVAPVRSGGGGGPMME